MARLTTTSYGVLALLAKRPWSAYDLTREIRLSLSQCWPRAETGLYREPKNLVAQGLARAKAEMKGRQQRTVYSITPAGRRALRKWYQQPAARPVFESEAVVRTVFAEHGTRQDLLATLAELEGHIHALTEEGFSSIPPFIERVGSSPEQVADTVLVAQLYLDVYAAVIAWTRWARQQVAARPETWTPEAGHAALASVAALIEQHGGGSAAPGSKAQGPAAEGSR